ncbi:MAG TPA: hypothetical protein VF615_02695 [Longimicrobiaceae bacterium]
MHADQPELLATDAYHEQLVYEREHPIKVADSLQYPHPLVRRTATVLRRREQVRHGLVWPDGAKCLDVRVSKKSLDRALRILDALLNALDERGYTVSLLEGDAPGTCATIHGESVPFRLEEKLRQTKPERPVRRGPRRHVRDSLKELEFRVLRYDLVPTGELSLRLVGRTWNCKSGLRQRWADGKSQRVEECLNDFILGLIGAARAVRANRLRREERERERQEAQLRWAEEQRLRLEEEARIRDLEQQAAAWEKSRHLREYLNAVVEAVTDRGRRIEPDSEMERWLHWARSYADRIDPIQKLTSSAEPAVPGNSPNRPAR